MKKYKNYLEIAKYLLKIEKKAYNSVKKSKVDSKDKQPGSKFKNFDLVTNYDTSIEKFLIAKLNKAFDNPKIVSEEFNSKTEVGGTYFVIDPVDGTINFASDINIWAVQVAYVENDEIVASAMFNPNVTYFAAKGFGAYKNGKRFFTKKKPTNRLLYNNETKYPNFVKIFFALKEKFLQQRCLGAASTGLAWVAEGKLGAYIFDLPANPWDTHPGLLIVKEAGGCYGVVENLLVVANSEKVYKEIEVALKKEYSKKTSLRK